MIQTAAEIGNELTRFVQHSRMTEADQEVIRWYVDRLTATPGLTAVDALAFVALAENLTVMAAGMVGDDEPEKVRYVLEIAGRLNRRATETLELMTGYARDGFSAVVRHVN